MAETLQYSFHGTERAKPQLFRRTQVGQCADTFKALKLCMLFHQRLKIDCWLNMSSVLVLFLIL